MIQVSGISKSYGKNRVLQDISISFEVGSIYGLVGTNGCGKTTLMRCICGFTQPNQGVVVVNGCLVGGRLARNRAGSLPKSVKFTSIADFAPKTGVIIEEPGFLTHLSGMRNLMLLSAAAGRPSRSRAEEAMRLLGLDPQDRKSVGKYSLGMRQRLGFAQAFMDEPDVLILDEPFNAMDAHSMSEVHNLLQIFKTQGKTVVLASHSAADIEKACDVVYEMQAGNLTERTH